MENEQEMKETGDRVKAFETHMQEVEKAWPTMSKSSYATVAQSCSTETQISVGRVPVEVCATSRLMVSMGREPEQVGMSRGSVDVGTDRGLAQVGVAVSISSSVEGPCRPMKDILGHSSSKVTIVGDSIGRDVGNCFCCENYINNM